MGVNIMVATKGYEDYVKAAAEAGADLIISGAGLPVTLPEAASGVQREDGEIRQAKAFSHRLQREVGKCHHEILDEKVQLPAGFGGDRRASGRRPSGFWTGNSLRISKGCIMKKRSCVSWRP